MITYKTGTQQIDWPQLCSLYGEVGLVAGLGKAQDCEKIKDAFSRSYKVVTAWDGDMLVGAGRMLSDGICYAIVNDVGILPAYQRRGAGRGLMSELLKDEENIHIYLTSTFGNEEFYKKLGFKRHKTAFAKYPCASEYLED